MHWGFPRKIPKPYPPALCAVHTRLVHDWCTIVAGLRTEMMQSSHNRPRLQQDCGRIETETAIGNNCSRIVARLRGVQCTAGAVRCALRTGLAHDWHSIGGPIGCPVSWALYLQSSSNRENISSDWYRIEARLYAGFEVQRCAHFTLHWIAA